jgi:hypothetical protein
VFQWPVAGAELRCAKKQLTLPVCLIAGLSGAATFRAYAQTCTIGPSSMSSFACISNDLLITNIWMGEGELDFPEAYGEELDILQPLKVGRGLIFLFHHRYRDIGGPDLNVVADQEAFAWVAQKSTRRRKRVKSIAVGSDKVAAETARRRVRKMGC